MQDAISKFVLDWKTLVGMVLITVSGVVWINSRLMDIENRLHQMNIEITKELGNVREETAQYHAIVNAALQEQERMEKRFIKDIDDHKNVDTRNRTALWNAIRELRNK